MSRLSELIFPHDKGSARKRRMQVLGLTVLGALAASALIALMLFWVHNSGRF